MTGVARFDVTAAQIDRVVAAFYEKVRCDPVLGPIFQEKVEDWPEHEVKITAFWRNAILFERSYSGNPMRAHMAAGTVKAAHFPVWLDLFDHVLKDHLPAETAQMWSALAHRIGAGLRYGVEGKHVGGVPSLTP